MGMNKLELVSGLAAATASSASAPAAYSAHSSGATAVTSNAATDLDTAAAALEALRDEVAALTTQFNALVVDVAAIRSAINNAN
jgi:hypothetical protein